MSNMLNNSAFDRFAVEFKTGQVIFCEYEQGSDFYMLKSGRVKLMRVVDDIEKTIGVLESGSFFGEMALLSDTPRSVTAIALEPTILLAFNKQNFDLLLKSNPIISTRLLSLFADRIYEQQRQLSILKINDDAVRVADVLVMLGEDMEPMDESNKYLIPTTAEAVANWAGISPEKVRKILDNFANSQRVELFPDKIVVRNLIDFTRMVKNHKND